MIQLVPFKIEGVHLLIHETHVDERGDFTELFNSAELAKRDISFNVSQVNYVNSKRGVLRGFHYQLSPFPQAKIVRCLEGAIRDIFIDLRPESPTFKQYGSFPLSPMHNNSIYIPPGIGHGYLVWEDSVVQYLVSGPRIPELERVLRWDDPEINIGWDDLLEDPVIMSERDKNGSLLKDLIHELS